MIQRTLNRQNIAWFIDLINRKLMVLDPPYQRRSVWTKSYKRFFIDTIMRNYPSPSIFLNTIVAPNGVVTYYVVDGKQRLESIMDFVQGKIAIPDDFGNLELNGKYFGELSNDNRSKLWGYEISVENLQGAEEEIINDTFDRLNRNVLKLTAQELRHAKYSGRFISLITEVADDPFWEDICISRPATIRRMKDVEFISELFFLTMHGISTTDKDLLDNYYAEYDEEIPNEKKARKEFDKVKGSIIKLKLDTCSNRLSNYSDFYSLWAALLELIAEDIDFEASRKNILKFIKKVDIKSLEKDVTIYQNAISAQPNDKVNRESRKIIIKKLIKTK
ncbi:MAG: DUF262 domain-containing protein [bacterium]|nr:DUF262 domain-containing protein [bacterium]